MRCVFAAAAAAACASSALGGVIDFASGPSWTPGTLGPYTYSSDGVDASVSIADAGGVTYGSFPQAGNFFGIDSLWLAGNFASDPSGDDIVVTIEFSQAVTEVEFMITDLDGSGGAVDKVTLSGALAGGSPIAADATLGANIDQIDAFEFRADGTANGDPGVAGVTANFSFDGPVDSITLSYSSTRDTQGIIIGNVGFTVPAPGSAALMGLAGLAAARRRR